MMYQYTIEPEGIVIDEDGTRNIYIMCHHGTRHEVGEWMEAGCQNAVDLSSPRVFTWVSVLGMVYFTGILELELHARLKVTSPGSIRAVYTGFPPFNISSIK